MRTSARIECQDLFKTLKLYQDVGSLRASWTIVMPHMQDHIHPTIIGAVMTCKRAAQILTKNPLHLLPDACGKQKEKKAAKKVPRPGTMLRTARMMATGRGRTGNAFLNTPGFSSTSRISPPNSAASRDV